MSVSTPGREQDPRHDRAQDQDRAREPDRVVRLSEQDLDALEQRYAPTQVPLCRLCGGPLTIGAIGGGQPTQYACAAAGFGPDKQYGSDHYRDSRWTDYRQGGDWLVMDAVAEVRAHRAEQSGQAARAGHAGPHVVAWRLGWRDLARPDRPVRWMSATVSARQAQEHGASDAGAVVEPLVVPATEN